MSGADAVVRPMRADEGPVWQGLFASVAEEGRWIGAEAPVHDGSREIVEKLVGRDDGAMFLAEVDGVAVGWITVELEDGRAEIGMGIVAGYRRRGIGTDMMVAAIDWAADRGADHMHLDVFPHNEAAIGLYRSLGFVEVERRPEAWPRRNGERWDLVVMQRPLER